MNHSRRILVVDDQQDILDLTATVLGGAGYEVTTLVSGSQAIERLEAELFDLVLLDINMPGMDGWETLRLIRADERLAALPIAMFSVKDDFAVKVQGMQEGAVDYISKPFVVDELLLRVARILDSLPGRKSGEPAARGG